MKLFKGWLKATEETKPRERKVPELEPKTSATMNRKVTKVGGIYDAGNGDLEMIGDVSADLPFDLPKLMKGLVEIAKKVNAENIAMMGSPSDGWTLKVGDREFSGDTLEEALQKAQDELG